MIYTLDTEFDGHRGPLLSIALVAQDGTAFYYVTLSDTKDSWVKENVEPFLIGYDEATTRIVGHEDYVGMYVRDYPSGDDGEITIVADSPVDIARVCDLLSTDNEGNWTSCNLGSMTFEVWNVDCWPNDLPNHAVQHNAYWDARALWEKIGGYRMAN